MEAVPTRMISPAWPRFSSCSRISLWNREAIRTTDGTLTSATASGGMTGTAFLYTNQESISVGIGCLVSDFRDNDATPYALLEPKLALVVEELSQISELPLSLAPNLIEATSDAGIFMTLSGTLKRAAVKLSKICP